MLGNRGTMKPTITVSPTLPVENIMNHFVNVPVSKEQTGMKPSSRLMLAISLIATLCLLSFYTGYFHFSAYSLANSYVGNSQPSLSEGEEAAPSGSLLEQYQPQPDPFPPEAYIPLSPAIPDDSGVISPPLQNFNSIPKGAKAVDYKPSKKTPDVWEKMAAFSNHNKYPTMLSSNGLQKDVLASYNGKAYVPGYSRFSSADSVSGPRPYYIPAAEDVADRMRSSTSKEKNSRSSTEHGGKSKHVASKERVDGLGGGQRGTKTKASTENQLPTKTKLLPPTAQTPTRILWAPPSQPQAPMKEQTLFDTIKTPPSSGPKPLQLEVQDKGISVPPAMGDPGAYPGGYAYDGQTLSNTRLQPNASERSWWDVVYNRPVAIQSGPIDPTYRYPPWWTQAWSNTAVWEHRSTFVGDRPLYPQSCLTSGIPWEAYPFVEPKSYVSNSKNPCWYKKTNEGREMRCLPYFYLGGVAKCGTTDLSKRIRLHPDVFAGTMKEYHWWERFRFGSNDEDDMEDEIDLQAGMTFKEYTDKISGEQINDLREELKDLGSSVRIFGDFSPSYLWDPRKWNVLEGNQNCSEPRVIVGQHIHHVFPQAKVILTFRHPTPRLYSRFLSRTTRTHILRKATAQDFHTYVLEGIQIYQRCFAQYSVRQCAYNVSVYRESMVRLVEGMYPVFMADWLRVFPRENLLLLRYEDYGGHEGERLAEIFEFLGLAPLEAEEMEDLLKFDAVNSGSKEYEKLGPMLEETKAALDNFYQPFIQTFAELLGDKRFLWKDVAH